MEAAAIVIAAAGVLAAALLGGLARSLFKMYSAKKAECEKLKDDNKYLQTIIHACGFKEKAEPGTAKNLLDAVCDALPALPAGTCAIVVVPPPPPFHTQPPEEVLEAVRTAVPVGTALALCHADGSQKSELRTHPYGNHLERKPGTKNAGLFRSKK